MFFVGLGAITVERGGVGLGILFYLPLYFIGYVDSCFIAH